MKTYRYELRSHNDQMKNLDKYDVNVNTDLYSTLGGTPSSYQLRFYTSCS